MQTIEHIIVVILFIIVVIQTIRSAYFKINYKALEELNEYHLEKIKDSSNKSDHFEKANIYLRGKLDTVRQKYTKLENQFNYYKKNDWEHLYRLVDEKLKKERNKVKELESLIAATLLKKVKPLNTALNEMNKTADKVAYDIETRDVFTVLSGKKMTLKEALEKVNNEPYRFFVDPYDKEEEDQYNTTAEDNEDSLGTKNMEKYPEPNKSYEDFGLSYKLEEAINKKLLSKIERFLKNALHPNKINSKEALDLYEELKRERKKSYEV